MSRVCDLSERPRAHFSPIGCGHHDGTRHDGAGNNPDAFCEEEPEHAGFSALISSLRTEGIAVQAVIPLEAFVAIGAQNMTSWAHSRFRSRNRVELAAAQAFYGLCGFEVDAHGLWWRKA